MVIIDNQFPSYLYCYWLDVITQWANAARKYFKISAAAGNSGTLFKEEK
jgi:hypothetical protein